MKLKIPILDKDKNCHNCGNYIFKSGNPDSWHSAFCREKDKWFPEKSDLSTLNCRGKDNINKWITIGQRLKENKNCKKTHTKKQ